MEWFYTWPIKNNQIFNPLPAICRWQWPLNENILLIPLLFGLSLLIVVLGSGLTTKASSILVIGVSSRVSTCCRSLLSTRNCLPAARGSGCRCWGWRGCWPSSTAPSPQPPCRGSQPGRDIFLCARRPLNLHSSVHSFYRVLWKYSELCLLGALDRLCILFMIIKRADNLE